MTIIAEQKEFYEEFHILLEMALYYNVIIKRDDGTMLALNKIKDSQNQQIAKLEQ